MTDFPKFDYSKKELNRVGKALAGEILWREEDRDTILRIFDVANNFRVSHAYPMVRLHHEMMGKMRKENIKGITGARLKRMPSIRGKLARIPEHLSQLQDLGGCRAILPSMRDVNKLLAAYEARAKHDLDGADDYINNPKKSGYRSHHLIFKFRPNDEDDSEFPFKGRRIELQIRTRLQHAWATAVETLGLFKVKTSRAVEETRTGFDYFTLFLLSLQ